MTQLKFLQAQDGDCFLISFKDNDNKPRNILIDGGRECAYYDSTTNLFGALKEEIDSIRNRNEYIDLLVLSHIDSDHICGLLKWFETDKNAFELVKNVWFNSGKLIADYLRKAENLDLNVGLKIFQTTETGVNEAVEFENYLIKKNIWERKIILKNQTINDCGVQMQILSPNENQLSRLLKEYRKKLGETAYTAGKGNDWKTTLKDFIEEELKVGYQFEQDTSPKNGSSISFVLTINNINFLFLGDAHPKDIVVSLKELGYNEGNPLIVDIFKISHHGSKSNTHTDLLKLVKTNNYIISTDSTRHNHPHKRTLARIINHNPNAVFHFNYTQVKENVMLPQDFKDFPNMKIKLTTIFDFE